MDFASFDEALHICMTAEPDSSLQDAALAYCLENAPPELKARLKESFLRSQGSEEHSHDGECGCGCGHEHHQHD